MQLNKHTGKIDNLRIDIDNIIPSDYSFFLHHQIHSEPLCHSIKEIGVVNPPLLQRVSSNDRFRIVCGFRRVHALRMIRVQELECRVLPPDIADRDLLLISIYDNLATHPLHPLEKSIVIAKLESFFDKQEIIRTYFPLLGLPAHKKSYEETACLARLEDRIKDAVYRGNLVVARSLFHLSQKERLAVFDLLETLHLSVSKQREVIDYLIKIHARESVSLCDLVRSDEITEILQNKRLNRSQRGERVRSYLYKRRFPEISRTEEKFHKLRRSLRLGDSVKLIPSLSFESDTFHLQFSVDSVQDLQKKIRQLRDSQDESGWEELFRLC